MSHKKKALPNFNSELHSILPLPIEMIVQRIATLTGSGFSVQIEKLSEDNGLFTISHPLSGTTKLRGNFMRWNGTFTRLDCHPQSIRELGRLFLPTIFSLTSIGILVLMFLSIDWEWWGFWSIFLIFFFSPVLIGLFWGVSSIFWANKGDKKSQKLVDQMLQALANALTAGTEGILEFDGSELSLEALLKEGKYQHLQMGEDGEAEDKA